MSDPKPDAPLLKGGQDRDADDLALSAFLALFGLAACAVVLAGAFIVQGIKTLLGG